MTLFIARELGATQEAILATTLPRRLNKVYENLFKMKYRDKLDALLMVSGAHETKQAMSDRWDRIVNGERDQDQEMAGLGSLVGANDIARKIRNRRAAEAYLEGLNG